MEKIQLNKESASWDIVKLFLAFFVTMIHVGSNTGNADIDFYLREWLSRMAVPLFFFSSGYFLFKKLDHTVLLNEKSSEAVKKYSLRLLFMFIIWSVIYLIPTFYDWKNNFPSFRELLIKLEYLIVRGDSYLHLWYLSSLFAASVLIYFFNKHFSLKKTFFISFVLFIPGLFWFSHYYLIKDFVSTNTIASGIITFLNRYIGSPRNGLFFGFVFVCMGALVGQSGDKLIYIKKANINLVLAILFSALSFSEVYLMKKYSGYEYNTYCSIQLSHIPAVYFWQSFFNTLNIRAKPFHRTLRKISTFIYLLHPMFLFLFDKFAYNLKTTICKTPLLYTVFIYTVSFAVSLALIKLEQNKHFRFIKYLH